MTRLAEFTEKALGPMADHGQASTQSLFSAVLLAIALAPATVGSDQPDALFETKIRPVLTGTCFTCHGDAKTSGGLRVDSRAALVKGGDSGPAIVPGNAEDSLLIQAIRRLEHVSVMPPQAEFALRPDQVSDFQAWVAAGAPWPSSPDGFSKSAPWSFAPVRDPPVPAVVDRSAILTSVDSFVRAAQASAGVRPAPPADRLTLIRRATFDLTGLPPTPEEIDAYLADSSPDAFAAVLERLLASPAYGERWGRHWLDVVRYADTAGETADYPLPDAWRYRNYVIDAFNADLPYDEFLLEQIAGDVLAQADPGTRFAERVIATGFLALSRRFGFDSENYHHLTIQDTIDTLGQVVMGMSLGCARCHDHKFDPVTMRDYYALYGIFSSSRYSFPGSEQKQRTRVLVPLTSPSDSPALWRRFEHRVGTLSKRLAEMKKPVPTAVLRSLNDLDGDFETQAVASGGSKGVLVPPWVYEGPIAVSNAAQSPFKNCYPTGIVGTSIAAGSAPYRIAQAIHPKRAGEWRGQCHVNLDFRIGSNPGSASGVHRFSLGTLAGNPALAVLLSSEGITLRTGEGSGTFHPLTPNNWQSLQLTVDVDRLTVSGHVGAPGAITELAERPLAASSSGAIEMVSFDTDGAGAAYPAIELDNFSIREHPILPVSTELPGLVDASNPLDSEALLDQLRILLGHQGEAARLEQLLSIGPCSMAYAMAEGTPRDERIQLRGEPDKPGEVVPRGFIASLGGGPLPPGTAGSGRLELARWLTRADHPLTPRVMVNRVWQQHFGRGLVPTPNDFGVRGQPPTHPDLLDHLTTTFVRSGWSIKALQRLIMQSATYQQASLVEPAPSAGASAPIGSDLLASFSRRRLSAEEIRDAILAVSGNLDRSPGREHPFPKPVEWRYTQHSPFSAIYDHRRRSVYLMTQRIKRHPFLALFDGADPNASTAQRQTTTVATQALYFLNDPFVHEAAEHWATDLLAGGASERDAIAVAYRRALVRPPLEAERAEAAAFLTTYRAKLVQAGSGKADILSLAGLLRALFATNEFLHVD